MVALIEAMDTGAMRGEIDLTRLATAACMKRSIESLSRGIASAPAMARKIGGIVAGATVSRCAGKYLGTSESTWAAGCAGRTRLAPHVLEIEIRMEEDEAANALARARA